MYVATLFEDGKQEKKIFSILGYTCIQEYVWPIDDCPNVGKPRFSTKGQRMTYIIKMLLSNIWVINENVIIAMVIKFECVYSYEYT